MNWKDASVAAFGGGRSMTVKESMSFPGGSVVKNPPASIGDLGSIPGLGRYPGGGNGTNSSILDWEITWTEDPGRLQTMGSQKSWTWLSE